MAWNILPATPSFAQLATSRLLGKMVENFNRLRTPPQYIYTRDPALGNITINSTTYALPGADSGFSTTLVFTGNPVDVIFYAGDFNVTQLIIATILVDGVDIGTTNGLFYQRADGVGIMRWTITGLTAGQHQIDLNMKLNAAGTGVINATSGIQFIVKEW